MEPPILSSAPLTLTNAVDPWPSLLQQPPNKSYTSQVLAFSQARAPNLKANTQVIAVVELVSSLVTNSVVTVEINSGAGWYVITQASLSGLVATITQPINFIVPANAQYRLIKVFGSPLIVTVVELVI